MKYRLSIIIPAYNEEDRIIKTLKQTIDYLNQAGYSSQILVVSDGSSDHTGDVVRSFDPGRVSLDFLEYHPNRGKGYAVRHGMMRGRGEIIMFMDADYSVPIEAVETGLDFLEKGADIAIASRGMEASRVSRHQNLPRELSARLYTLIQNIYLGMSYKDTQCGFKLFKADAAKTLFQKQKLHSVIFDPEILWLAKRSGLTVAQFPVIWHHMEDSRIQYDSLGKFLFVFKELFRIRKLHR